MTPGFVGIVTRHYQLTARPSHEFSRVQSVVVSADCTRDLVDENMAAENDLKRVVSRSLWLVQILIVSVTNVAILSFLTGTWCVTVGSV